MGETQVSSCCAAQWLLNLKGDINPGGGSGGSGGLEEELPSTWGIGEGFTELLTLKLDLESFIYQLEKEKRVLIVVI